ncbi:hypothetical protein OIU79_009371 [Salix purpurea]|uniref:Malectin-like domain-containing protein n=1 Tax=Salix purpurea TaxID=77065 RepID=A0A9Q0YX46_SALPP|nr:hypothetical protein OIU79_009371 [Salix purpurea]
MAGCLVILFLAFLSISGNAQVSIDCGASETYTDENSLVWIGDDGFFKNSESAVVRSNNTVSHVMSTLRVFTSLKKNCYTIRADKGSLVLVRASFFYGNYDKKSSPPSFLLLLDGNYWSTVKTTLDEPGIYEVMYVVKSDTISICLAQTQPNQLPFISALEFRKLDSTIYAIVDPNYALFVRSRTAFGANLTVRFPDDVYDRIWVPGRNVSGRVPVASDAKLINVTTAPDNPPRKVLQNAITNSSSSDSITLNPSFHDHGDSVYMNLNLSSLDLSGPLPDFSSMDALVTIDLHNNSLTGPIPDFLGALANLVDLNLADNSFSGLIPPSISSNKKLKLV